MADQLRYATAAVDNSPELLAIADALTARTGRPRNIPFRALLIVCCLHARVEPTNMYRTRIADLLVSLTATQRRDLGITGPISYSQVERAALKLDRAARDGITLPHLADDQTAQTLHLDEVMSLICSAALPPGFITTATVAADGMDFESPARPQGFVDKRTGEILQCADPDAGIGHRTATPSHPSSWFTGQEVTLVTNAPDRPTSRTPSPDAPTVVLAAGIRAAASDRARVTAGLVLWWHRRVPVRECTVDRGISQGSDDDFAQPLRRAGIEQIIDLKTQDRKIHTAWTNDLVLMINGGVFTKGIPEALYTDLPTPKLSDTTEEKIRKHEIYDRLQPYACQPLTAIDDAGRQRFRGPAHKHVRRVRCPNSPRSMRWSILPKTRCIKGEPCICSTTFTLGPEDDIKLRQRDLWMTTKWKASYGRRNMAEQGISQARVHAGKLVRMYTQVRNRAGQGIAAAFSLFGTNRKIIQDWYDARGLDDPWVVFLGEQTLDLSDHPRIARANRKKPKASLLKRLTSGTDPPR